MPKTAELNIQRKSLKDVKPNPKNPRLHSREQLQRLEKSLEDFGYAKGSMVVNKDGYLLAGHGIYESLRAQGYEEADFVIVDLEPGVAEAWMIADNRLGDLSDWNMAELEALTAEIVDMDVELDMTGFGDLGELEELFEADNRVVKQDDPPAVSEEEPITQMGDLWALGNHALFCGDSSAPENLNRLMGGCRADMGLTSPPYAVGKEYEAGISFDQHLELLRCIADRSLEAIKPGGFFFINFGEISAQSHVSPMTGSNRQCVYPISKDYWQIFHEERGMDLYAQRIWYKPFNRLQQPFWTYKTSIPHYQEWEHIWTWRLPGGDSDMVYDWDVSSRAVWDTRTEATEDRPLTRHVAAFPVGIPERAIRAHSDEGDMIWEPFCGSGTTLIAADQLGRICMGSELNPAYCDVIVQRYINHAGHSDDVFVERDGKRLTWDEVQNHLVIAGQKVHVC